MVEWAAAVVVEVPGTLVVVQVPALQVTVPLPLESQPRCGQSQPLQQPVEPHAGQLEEKEEEAVAVRNQSNQSRQLIGATGCGANEAPYCGCHREGRAPVD